MTLVLWQKNINTTFSDANSDFDLDRVSQHKVKISSNNFGDFWNTMIYFYHTCYLNLEQNTFMCQQGVLILILGNIINLEHNFNLYYEFSRKVFSHHYLDLLHHYLDSLHHIFFFLNGVNILNNGVMSLNNGAMRLN